MFVKGQIMARQFIKSSKTGQDFTKVWVALPRSTDSNTEGTPVESTVVPGKINCEIDQMVLCSVDRFGRLHDIEI